MAKKILIMVASPKNERSGTLIPTKAFVDGMLENGDYEAEYVFIDRLNIKPCRGCLTCWGRPDGSCFIKGDDVPETRKKLEEADVVIWSFPLFLFSIPGQMKVLLDRIVGMVHPYMGQKLSGENSTHDMNKPMHGLQHQKPGQKIILLSSCAWMDIDVVYAIDLMQKPIFGEDAYVTLVTEFVTHMFDRDDNF